METLRTDLALLFPCMLPRETNLGQPESTVLSWRGARRELSSRQRLEPQSTHAYGAEDAPGVRGGKAHACPVPLVRNTHPLPVLSDRLPRGLVSAFGISVGKPSPVAPQKEQLQAQEWWEPGQGHLEQTPRGDKFPWKAAHLYIKRMQIV